jgi:hypothetical protein
MTTKPKRKGRPLLACAVGIAFVSYTQCTPDKAVGNMPEPTPDAQPIPPVGNLRAPEPEDVSDATAADIAPPDAAATVDASTPKKKPDAGALVPIPPEPTHQPVGNLRAPPQNVPR